MTFLGDVMTLAYWYFVIVTAVIFLGMVQLLMYVVIAWLVRNLGGKGAM